MPKTIFARIHVLRFYLRAAREAYKWDLYAAHLGKQAAQRARLVGPVRQAYLDGQEGAMEAARQSLHRIRDMERYLDATIAKIKEEESHAQGR